MNRIMPSNSTDKHSSAHRRNTITLMGLLLLIIALVPMTLHAQEEDVVSPDLILVERPAFFPEGIEYDAERDRFLLGSLVEGTIFEVVGDGEPTPFIEDPDIASSVGIHIDVERDRLLVVSSNTFLFMDPTLPYNAEVAAYDLETGERLFFTDLVNITEYAPNVANDVTVDDEGNAYVTDSLAPVIYRIDVDGEASVFWEDSLFDGQGAPRLNGIEYHPDGYLLVPADGRLYKVPVDDPAALSEVTLDAPLPAADGITLHPDGRLIAVQGQIATVTALESDDDWTTANIVGTAQTNLAGTATTAAIRNGEVYVIYSHILAIMLGETPPQAYEIVRIAFDAE
jgi:sugar lactone lactonase YvrE